MFKVLAIIGALLAVLEAVKENNKKKIKTYLNVVY
jgi:phosphotransferase system  glucose/maltose/N-acetylglucosamine-specific IIC component